MNNLLSIIIVSYNCKELLSKTIESIYTNSTIDYETIVVENGTDGGALSASLISSKIIVIVNKYNSGFAAANNEGFKKSTGKYILLLNPDTIILPNTILPLLAYMEENKKCGICGPKILNKDGLHTTNPCEALQPQKLFRDIFFNRLFKLSNDQLKPEQSSECAYVHGSCMLIRREVYEALGGLDESLFMYCEEFEISSRAREAGWKTCYVSDADVIHLGEGASSEALEWVLPLRWHSAIKVYSRYRNFLWMIYLRFAGLLNICVDLLSVISKVGHNRHKFKNQIRAFLTTLMVILLPSKTAYKFIPIPKKTSE